MLGDDGVRYYLAHLQAIDDAIEPGVEVTAGQRLGEIGRSGDASACHLHFGISPPCPGLEWSGAARGDLAVAVPRRVARR